MSQAHLKADIAGLDQLFLCSYYECEPHKEIPFHLLGKKI